MPIINYASKEIQFKVVYYGPALGGKTTNLQYIHSRISPSYRGDLISLATAADRTLFFDFLPVNSIVLTVTRKAEGGRDPSESWREIFHREESARRKEKEEGDKEPLKVEGVGDEAFWTGTRVGGAAGHLVADQATGVGCLAGHELPLQHAGLAFQLGTSLGS